VFRERSPPRNSRIDHANERFDGTVVTMVVDTVPHRHSFCGDFWESPSSSTYGLAPLTRSVSTTHIDREDGVMTSIPCLAKKDLSHVNLATADLHGADLHEATLRSATLKETNLEDADLTDTDLTDANLGGACLRNATASHANFEDADLRDADLTGANLRGARLAGAKLDEDQRAVAISAGADLDDARSEDTDSRMT
jgi:uncharacterized protein YjbI with pentapeptide repeats